MIRRALAVVAPVCILVASSAAGSATQPPKVPETRTSTASDVTFGERIADPFRWLEADARSDPEVAAWASAQDATTRHYTHALPQRAWFLQRLAQLMAYERYGLPTKAGGRYFYTYNSGLQNQSQLWMRKGLQGRARMLLDPAAWRADGSAALDDWKPSRSGGHVLYSIQEDGSDWRVLRVFDVKRGRELPDVIRGVRYTRLAWLGDAGFFYSRFPDPAPSDRYRVPTYNHAVWFHRLGTDQSQDTLVFASPGTPEANHALEVTSDGRWAVIVSSVGADARKAVRVIDLARHTKAAVPLRWAVRELVSGFQHDWQLVNAVGDRIWFVTNRDAPLYRLVSVNLRTAKPVWAEVVAEAPERLQQAAIVGSNVVLNYQRNGATHALVFDFAGNSARELALSDTGTANGFQGRPGDPETFYAFSSFNRPASIFRLDLATGKARPFAEPRLTFRPGDYVVEQRRYPSRDGTQVPMFIVRSRQVATAARAVPTILYGYGGFDIALNPGFSSARMAWLEAGGAVAVANVRGGGELGKAWHDGGRLANKQNAFDDFIAAGEYLIAEGITSPGGLAAQGSSNGGLLVAAAVNQRPDLFAAANPQAGVLDMLRFDRFTAGRYWTDDYGRPEVERDFRILRAYSPYHNVRVGRAYPAILVTTGGSDDRVVPAHSFKYAAALQAADLGPRPRLLRVEQGAGHGPGRPTGKAIEENADILAFLAHWTGLKPPQ